MLPRARSCVGKSLDRLPAACADSLTTEPLLFLYPRWFQDAVQFPQRFPPPRRRKFSVATRPQNRATAAAAKVDDGDHPVPIEYPHDYQRTSNATSGSKPQTCDLYEAPKPCVYHSAPSTRPDHKWRAFDPGLEKSSRKIMVEAAQDTSRNASRPVRRNMVFDPKAINGLDLARKLARTRSRCPAGVEKILLSAAFLEQLTGTSGENIWVHHDGSGCLIHVSPLPKENGSQRTVSLIGSVRAREITSQHLRRTERNYNSSSHYELKHGTEDHRPATKKHERVDLIPLPKSWNLKLFAEHVQAIVSAQAPRGIERILYPGEDSFNKTAATVLMELFARPELRIYQSSSALRCALEFCSRRTDIAYAARSIWGAARQAGIIPDIACFNLEIGRCFRVGNAAGIAQYVSEMRSTHIEPNDETWALFLKSLRTKDNRYHFMQLPGVRDWDDTGYSKEMMVPALVETEFKPSDEVPAHTSKFQEVVDKAYGKNWLTTSVIRSMIEKCIRARAPQTVSKVLRLAAERSVELDVESSTSIWKAVARTGWFEDTLLLLKMQSSQLDPLQNQKVIELAFRTAWKCCLVNTCRVLWHYAASHGLIRHTMLKKISDRLSYNPHPAEESRMQLNSRLVACMVGTDRCDVLRCTVDQEQTSIDDLLQNLKSLTVWKPEGEARHNQMQLAHEILERDMTAWQRFEPMQYKEFIDLIERAYILDKAWQAQDLFSTLSQHDLLTEAIPIELKPVRVRMASSTSGDIIATEDTVVVANQPSAVHPCIIEPVLDGSVAPSQASLQRSDSESTNSLEILRFQTVRNTYSASNAPAVPIAIPTAIVSLPIIDAMLHYLGLAWQDV